jgi:hypothetical protein
VLKAAYTSAQNDLEVHDVEFRDSYRTSVPARKETHV